MTFNTSISFFAISKRPIPYDGSYLAHAFNNLFKLCFLSISSGTECKKFFLPRISDA